jgi:hypothetical protein
MLLGRKKHEEEVMRNDLNPNEMQSKVMGGDEIIEEAVVFMHVTHPNSYLKCMKFKGQIGKSLIYALIDSRSTYSFVDPTVL